jgi:metallo-beta-lactamase family protein
VRAEVGLLRASSGHADADELLGWMRQLNRPPRQVFITHGEPPASEALRSRIEHELGWTASVPSFGDSIGLPTEG